MYVSALVRSCGVIHGAMVEAMARSDGADSHLDWAALLEESWLFVCLSR